MQFAKALLTLALFRHAPPQTLRFAGIAWGDAPATVERKLIAGGFTPTGVEDGGDGDLRFRGRVTGFDGEGWIYFAQRRAVKALFVVRPSQQMLVGTYDRMRGALLRQYGPTRHQVALYRAPYARGDGRDLEALRDGKLYLATAWKDGPDTGELRGDDPGIILHITKALEIYLAFEGPGWTAEAARRRAANAR